MEVYIEYAIIDNLVMNAILLHLSFYINQLKYKKWQLILSNILGTICSILIPLFIIPNALLLAIKIALAMSMIFVATGKIKIKKYILILLTFLTLTFLFGGLCFGVIEILGLKVDGGGVLLFNDFSFPMSILIVVIACYVWVIRLLVHTIKNRLNISSSFVDVDVRKDNVCVHLLGYIDTGNFACDKNGNSLIFISPRMFHRLFPKIDITKFVLQKIGQDDIAGSYYTKINDVTKNNITLVVPIDNIEVNVGNKNKSTKNVFVAVSQNNFGGEFDILLSPQFIGR